MHELNVTLFVQLPKNWEVAKITVLRPGEIHTGSRCVNTIPDDDNQVFSLPSGSRLGSIKYIFLFVVLISYIL